MKKDIQIIFLKVLSTLSLKFSKQNLLYPEADPGLLQHPRWSAL